MPYQCSWYIEKKVIFVEFIGKVTLEDTIGFNNDVLQMLEGNTNVHLLASQKNQESVDIKPTKIRDVLSIFRHSSIGWILTVGNQNKVTAFLTSMITQLFGVRHRSFPTAEEGLLFLAEVDHSLEKETVLKNIETIKDRI